MQTMIEEFLTGFRSRHTKNAYKNDLVQFFNFCSGKLEKEIISPNEIGETMCVMWNHHIRQMENSNQTLARKMAALSSFFKYCLRKKMIGRNPVEFIARPKIANIGKTNILTKEEWMHTLNEIQKRGEFARIQGHETQFKMWKKRYAILHTLFTVGMRVEECCKLKYEDLEKIDENIYRLHLLAKGNQKHAPLIHKKTALVLVEYMNLCSITKKGQPIFGNIHRTSIYHMVKLCVKTADISKNVSPHSLRASLATHLHEEGVPLGHIKDLLNHKNMATTLLYTRVSERELMENAQLLAADAELEK